MRDQLRRLHLFLRRLSPDTLFGRLVLTWILAMWITHILDFAFYYFSARNYAANSVHTNLANDVGTAVHVLEHAAPAEREAWLPKLERRHYRYALEQGIPNIAVLSDTTRGAMTEIAKALGAAYPVWATEPDGGGARFHLALRDGTPLTVHASDVNVPISWWNGLFFKLQMLAVALITWFAVRQATRPLARLAEAAESLGSSLQGAPIPETGPGEVVAAARAFNAMQRRIVEHLEERMRILAAISHDLQTPITRMRLRADLADNATLRDKFHGDLDAMQVLVEEGITYARSAQSITEPPRRIDLNAFLDSIAGDYADAGHAIAMHGHLARPLTTRPHALKRIVCNLTDNAIKFGGEVEVHIECTAGEVAIAIRDRGPGIPNDQLAAVLQPFYRLESSRNRATGGTGLGLAIAQQLSLALGGRLVLSNRDGGGLEARLMMPIFADRAAA